MKLVKPLKDVAAKPGADPRCDRVLLKWDAAALSLAAIGEQRLDRIIQSGAEVRWQRYATVRRVPPDVLRDAYRKYRSAIKRAERDGHATDLRPEQTVHWEQTEALSPNDSPTAPSPLSKREVHFQGSDGITV